MKKSILRNFFSLVFFVLISQSAGIIGTLFTSPAIPTWYASLNKPFFSPPNWVFAPVWITLYTFIGISIYLIWIKRTKKRKLTREISLFFFQLFLNAIWSPIFFGLKNLLLALVIILLLWISIFLIIKEFYKINKNASYILIPYILWVSFATILNLSILLLNY